MLFDKPDKATKYTPVAGDTLKSIAKNNHLTEHQLAIFNWGSADKAVVARALIEQLGAPVEKLDHDKPFEVPFDGKENTRAKGEILIPKFYGGPNFALEKTHTIKAKKPKQAPAVAICSLDKWFVPGPKGDGVEGEECEVKYALTGPEEVADKLSFDVYASNYADVEIDDKGVVKFTAIADPVPVWSELIAKEKMGKRDGTETKVPKYSGKTNAKSGALKPRADDKPKFLNAAFSPYTVTLRFYKDDADKDAYVELKPFFPVFETDTKPAKPESLEIKWKVKKTDKLKQGQLIITDKTGKVLCQRALKEDELKKDAEGKFTWDGKLPDGSGKVILKPNAPYRVQIQAHSETKEEKGLAIAAMHTEVRLFVHPDTGKHLKTEATKLQPWTDPNSLVLELAPVWPKALAKADGDKFVAKRLYDAGYYPGPVADSLTDLAKNALKEFQRSKPLPDGTGFKRQTPDGNVTNDVKDALDALPAADIRPMFGLDDIPAKGATALQKRGYADVAPADANGKLVDPNEHLITWINDRHYYTDPGSGAVTPELMGNYRPLMTAGDDRTKYDAETINRPALPVEAMVPLMRKSLDLSATDPFAGLGEAQKKKMLQAMGAAVGPLRVDWTFDEIGDDYENVEDTVVPANRGRTKKFLQAVISKLAIRFDPDAKAYEDDKTPLPDARDATKKYYTNTPVTLNGKTVGLRPNKAAGMGAYYKAAFTGDDGKLLDLTPCKAIDDATNKAVCAVAHGDFGQAEDKVFAERMGRSAVYLHPSRIAGDGYRFRAELSLEKTPNGTDNPNKDVLKALYPVMPVAHTAALRNWRRTAYRGYVPFMPATAVKAWSANRDPAAKHYHAAFVKFSHEGGAPTEYALANLMSNAEFVNVINGSGLSAPWTTAPTYTPGYVWPWLTQPRWGSKLGIDHDWSAFWNNELQACQTPWRKYRADLIFLLVQRVESKYGKLRGHLMVEFHAGPLGTVHELLCDACGRYLTYVFEGGATDYRNTLCNASPLTATTPACAGTLQVNGTYSLDTGLPLNAVGTKAGATWLFESGPDVWTHEMGHHRHLEHAMAYPTSPTPNAGAPGGKMKQHDTELNPWLAGDGEHSAIAKRGGGDKDWRWDRDCIMSYNSDPQYFCGKCVLKNRGWAVEGADLDKVIPSGGLIVEQVKIERITKESARITWKTSVAADSTVDYGKTNAFGSQETNASAVSDHSIEIKNLDAETEYHLRVTSKAGTETTHSRHFKFSTVKGVLVRNPQVTKITGSSAHIGWQTNIDTLGEARYGTSTSYGKKSAEASATAGKNHAALVTGLKPSTTYHYQLYSKDVTNLEGTSEDLTFQTAPPVVISNVQVSNIGPDTAKIAWRTDRQSKSYIKYDKGSFWSRSKIKSGGSDTHEITLTDLKEDTDYYYKLYAEGDDGTESNTEEATFKTKPKKK